MHLVLKLIWPATVFLGVLVSACSPSPQTDTATIAVAANFKPAMEQLGATFEATTGHEILIVVGSTGALFAQIQQGAPFDLLLAADAAHPARLEADGKGVAGTRFTYAVGQLVLWAPGRQDVSDRALSAPDLRHVALANPKHAPYGAAAMKVLQALELEDDLADRLVVGENVGQALVFVQTGNAELGFVALSQLLALSVAERGAYWSVPADLYAPIHQDGVLLTRAASNQVALDFIDYMQSTEARAIIASKGYQLP